MNNNTTKSEKPDIFIDKLLNNRYLIRDLLGEGGMGKVYLAEDVSKGCMLVAVKILTLRLSSQEVAKRFGREIFVSAQLGKKSKNIVRLLSYGVTDNRIPFYVMEYLRGRPLNQIIQKNYLNLPIFLELCEQICLGLHCAHQGVHLKGKIYPIVHRDIKPENIFINEIGKKSEMVKILDFGIAKFLTETGGMTLTDSFIGSLPYSSPEHMEGQKQIDARSDIYSLGLLMFEMLTGKHPLDSTSKSFGTWYQIHHFKNPPTFAEVNPLVEVPDELQKLVIHCLAKDPNERPQNVQEILNILGKIKIQLDRKNLLLNDHTSDNQKFTPTPAVELIPVTSVTEKECLQKKWPKNKPTAPIGFSHLLYIKEGVIPTFWAMLPQKEIEQFINNKHHTEFISQIHVYPMVLWVIMLSDEESFLTRWLSNYLDMKNEIGQKVVKSLEKTGYYHLLFFTLENPNNQPKVMTVTLSATQRQYLSDCINFSHLKNINVSSQEAKNLLKIDYEKVKLQIAHNLNRDGNKIKGYVKLWLGNIFDSFFKKS
ncbi:serine/threonine protein kinase [Dolichospermum sp. ST_con]|nr:serine/threonine protein kinase [Dolichospermum sp. ST_con]MDD1419731.1 serine/threonine protein kinase [Dolichospermum sp. ST_sed1]MDD1425247.1 serine/threonine protein kinase [Dolichospermum sp. ST_sed9]MDD1431904.1 serine/threonine protein kinase [Dolichospermum sp. ST_sed6]MDD1436344.1 serine/threonine protein kinase [Dolichospermum sp. ST_sed10]MDD1441243.1 serine/threonine protein kinase [Dolichospermum sp. ST_sed3]MDD1447052.1 serine/threonine protein kinase [Dolichospermum sp. ST_s